MAIKHISEVDKVQPRTMLIMKKDGTSVGEVKPHSLTPENCLVQCEMAKEKGWYQKDNISG